MFNSPSVTSSIDHDERSFIKHRARLNPSQDSDPWCLFCKTNLKTEHLPYKYIFDERLPLDRLIESRLGLELDETLPSAFLCYRCEKELQRMSWRDSTARGDMQSKLESNLHLWPPQSSLPAPGEGGTVSAESNTTSDHRRLFTKDAVSSSTFDSLEARAASHVVTMTSRERRDGKEKEEEEEIQAGNVEEKEREKEREKEEDHDGEEEDDEEDEGTLDDTTTYILYSTPTGTLETRLLSHESSWSPSRKRKEGKSRSSSRHSSGGSDKYSHLESSSLPRDYAFGDQLSRSNSSRLNKTDLSSGQDSNFNELVPKHKDQEMSVPGSSTFRTSSVTTSRLWEPSEKQEREDTLADDDEDSRESEEDAITTTTTTTTTTTMTTPKGTTQWTKTTIKTIWDDVDEQEEMEEVAVEVATPSTTLPSSTEAAVAAASAATKKAFSHSPDTRRRRREHRHSNKENNEEDYRAEEKRKKDDQDGQWSEKIDDNYQSANLDMDTSTRTTQYYDCSRMDSGRPRSLHLAGDHLGNVCLYRGNYGDVSRDLAEKDNKEDRTVSTEVDMQYTSPENDQDVKFLHSTPVYSADGWIKNKNDTVEYYSNNNEKMKQSHIEADYYYTRNKDDEKENENEKENDRSYREEKEEKEERNRRKERSEYYSSQHYERQDTVVCREFPYPPSSPDLQTSDYRSDIEVESSGRVDDGFRSPHGNQTETIINPSLASVGYQSTEFNSGYLPHSYPDNRDRNVKEHWSTTSTANSYVGVDGGQIHKDEGRPATIGWTDCEATTKPVEKDSHSKDPDPARIGLNDYTNLDFDQGEDSNEEMYPTDQGSWDKSGSSKKYGKGQGHGGGGGDDPRASGTSSPSHLKRQGSKESRSSGRHRKRRHKGRKRDRSRDSENSNDSSSSSNPVVQTHDEVGGSVKEFDCTHYEEQDNPSRDEEGVGATAIAVCAEHTEEGVLPSDDWYGKAEEAGGGATSRQLWTTATVGSDIGGGARCTPSPEIDHLPTTDLPYKLYTGDYRRSYYDNDGGDGDDIGGGGGGGGGENSSSNNNNNNNNKYEREEKTLDQDNNNVLNNSNDEFCNVERETTRVTGTEGCITSTYDTLEARPESYTETNDHYRQGDSGKKDTVLFSAPYHGQTSGFEELPSSLGNQQLSYPSSPHWDSTAQTVYTTQPDTEYISSTSYSYQHNTPYATFSSPVMDSQDDNKTNGDTNTSDTNAIYTSAPYTDENPTITDDLNTDINLMSPNNDANNIGEYPPSNTDSNQANFGEAYSGDANFTVTSTDTQQYEANMETSPKADPNETVAIRDDYESYHREMTGANMSETNADYTSSFTAFETSDKMEPTTTNDAGEVQDLEDAPSAGGWEGYKDNGTSNEQMMSLNDEIAQADQNTNWDNAFGREKYEEYSPKFDAWNQSENDPRPDTGNAEDDENKNYSRYYDKDFDNEKAEGQVDMDSYNNDYYQNYKEDSVEYTGFDAEERKDFSETYDKDPDLTEFRQDDSVNNTYVQQNETEKYSGYDDDRPMETGYVGENQDYRYETADYGGDYNATYNMEENSYYTREYGGDSGRVVDNFEERQGERLEDIGEQQENITDYKIEEEVDNKSDTGEYNLEQSPVEWGTSYTQDVRTDNDGPDAQETEYFCGENNNMADTDNQDGARYQQNETGIDDRAATEEYSWQTLSPTTESTAKRPMDLHLSGTIYNETSPTVEQGGDVEEGPSVETRNVGYIVSPAREVVRHSPYDSPGQRNEEVVVTESPADRGNYWMDETTGVGTYQEGEINAGFQDDSATAINETSMSPTAVMVKEDPGVEEQITMVHTEVVEAPIVPEIRPRVKTIYEAGQPSYDAEQTSYDAGKTSYGVEQTSYGVEQTSYDAGQTSYNAEQTSYNAGQTSYDAEQTSYDAGQTSYNAEQTSYNVGQTSYDAEQTSYNVGQTSYDAEQTSYNAGQSSYDAEQTSYEAGQTSYDAEQTSYNAGQTSYDAEQTSYNVEQTSYNAEQPSYDAEQTSYNAEQTSYDAGKPSYDAEQTSFDDSRNTSTYDSTNENVMIPLESRESYSVEPTWGTVRSHFEAETEIGGVIESRQEIVEETLIVPSIRERNDRYPYGYSSMMNDAVESRDTLNLGGQLSAPIAILESSTDLGETTFPCGSSEYQDVSAGDSNDALAATSVSGSYLDVPNNTEQKRWDSFESSKNKVPSTFGVEPHVERLRYGIRVRSGRAATSAGRKKDDQKPLIGSEWRPLDGKEFDDRDGDSGFWTPDTENDDTQETDTMPFGFGKKKKNESLIEKDVSPLPQPSKEVESAAVTITEKIEEVAFSAEDAVADQTEQVTVTMTETVVEEQAVVEVVTTDAADGGAEQLVEIEQTGIQIERDIDEMGENIEKDSKMEEVATIMEEIDEATMEDVDMTEEPEVIDQFTVEDKEMDLVFGHNTVDLDIAYEVMSVDLNELEDDEEVAILDRFEMLAQTDGQVEGGKDQLVENSEKDSKTEEATAETVEAPAETAETPAETAETPAETAEAPAETGKKDEPTKEEVVKTEEPEVTETVAAEDKETELVVSGDNAADSAAVTNEATSVELNKMEDDEEVAILDRFQISDQPVEPAPVEIVEEKTVVETPPAPVVEKQQKKQPRVESTPLIGKSTKVKDTQPGFLCCTIL